MDVTSTRVARPFDPATARSTSVARTEGPRLALDAGSRWRLKLSGETFKLTSRLRVGAYLLGPDGAVKVTLPELLSEYTWVGCSHEEFCCSTHGEHTIPHRGCILR